MYHPALKHAQDVPEISQSPLSDHTHQVEHWGCGCVPIVLASDDMQASAVEAVDTAHHCSSQRPCLGQMCQCGTHCQLIYYVLSFSARDNRWPAQMFDNEPNVVCAIAMG